MLVQRKVTKRKDTPISLPFGSPHHSTLPTGRLDSPSGLDKAKSDVPVGFALPKPNTSADFKGTDGPPLSSPKTALLVGSIDQGWSIESRRARMASRDDPLAARMAEGMRSTSAGGRVSLVTFFARAKKVTRQQGETKHQVRMKRANSRLKSLQHNHSASSEPLRFNIFNQSTALLSLTNISPVTGSTG